MAKIKKIQSSTLVETLVAMVIIMTTFSITIMISLNIEKFNNSRLKLKAYLLIENEMVNAKQGERFIDDELDFENIILRKSTTQYRGNKKIVIILIEAFDSHQRKIMECRELVIDEK